MTQTMPDAEVIQAFANFLSWGVRPTRPGAPLELQRAVPPAWYAYALGATLHCPPAGEI